VAQGLEFVEYVIDQVDDSCKLTHRMMFGGCTLYMDGKVVALICDDQLFVKPTKAGKELIGNVNEAPAYPGAKKSFLIEDQLEDRDWLTGLLRVTAAELPVPKLKKRKNKKEKKNLSQSK
jgi:TfoX/Sxy family transcriptional regulator of competence genes